MRRKITPAECTAASVDDAHRDADIGTRK